MNINSVTFFLSALFLFFFVAPLVSADKLQWGKCGSTAHHYNIETLRIDPDPPLIGQGVTAYITGSLDKEITGGAVVMALKICTDNTGHTCSPLPPFRFTGCEVFKCPLQPGPHVVNSTLTVPDGTPAAFYTGTFQALDQDKQIITCLSFNTSLVN